MKRRTLKRQDLISELPTKWQRGGDVLGIPQRAIYENIAKCCQGLTAFDVGCGLGFGTNILFRKNCSVIGVDLSEQHVQFAKHVYPDMSFYVHDVVRPLACKVDVIVCVEVIEHVKSYMTAIQHMITAATHVFISTPNVLVTKNVNPHHVREFGVGEMLSLLGAKYTIARHPETFESLTEAEWETVSPVVYDRHEDTQRRICS